MSGNYKPAFNYDVLWVLNFNMRVASNFNMWLASSKDKSSASTWDMGSALNCLFSVDNIAVIATRYASNCHFLCCLRKIGAYAYLSWKKSMVKRDLYEI